jgi:predicted permease
MKSSFPAQATTWGTNMTPAIATILAAVLPVMVTVAIGCAWVRSGRTFETGTLTPLIVDIGTPFLIFATFAKIRIPLESFAVMALATVVALASFALVGAAALALLGLRIRTFLPALSFPNNGNLGLPLALYAFGAEGLGYAIVFYSICMIGQFTAGQAMASGVSGWLGIARMPLVHAVLLGVAVSVLDLTVPVPVLNTVSLIGGMTIPLMLLMLGASLARLPLERIGRAGIVAGMRIGLGIAIGFAIATAFDLTGTARAVFILQCAIPPAVYNYLFAQKWNNDPEDVASVVVIATLASLLTVPSLLQFLLH